METPVLSLYELNNLIRGVLSNTFDQLFWIRAEMSDVRINQNGHCYLEFIEKDSSNKTVTAKARGSIWSNVFKLIKPYFESETGQTFVSGLKVLVQVSVEFHELYGYSLNVHDIDPSYTLGDQVRNRALIIKLLEEEGVLTLNKELELPIVSNRIAIISSPTAAGYEDFCDQLDKNENRFIFYTHLFPAVMQGERTETSIISALENIYQHIELFDAVVIIRGGGASSELSSFDSYLLATNCAQFPLPIITGIGHERDDTVLDVVAHTRKKTPTAVAEFLISGMQNTAIELLNIQEAITDSAKSLFDKETLLLNNLFTRFNYLIKDQTKDRLVYLDSCVDRLKTATRGRTISETTFLESLKHRFVYGSKQAIQEERHKLESIEQYIELVSPQNILKKGYTFTLKNNKIVKSAKDVQQGDQLTTHFYDGKIIVKVE